MVQCTTCGSELPPNIKYCPACGKPVQAPVINQTPVINQPVIASPAPQNLLTCPICRTVVPSTTTTCPKCAWRLRAADTSPAQVPPAPGQPPLQWSPPLPQPPHSHRVYKIAIALLLIAVISLAGVMAATTFQRAFSSGLPRNPYPIVGQDSSGGWSGFKFYHPSESITDVKGSWTVPRVDCTGTATDQHAAFWVGIDGVRNDSGTLEQIGTLSSCVIVNGAYAPHYAWFVEWYPALPRSSSVRVNPGDSITAEVSWNGAEFTATINDNTQGWVQHDYNLTIGNTALRASAEWIAEAPASIQTKTILPLANFDTVYFTNCFATTSDSSGPMGSFHLVQDTMTDSAGHPKAQAYLPFWNDGTSFAVQWVATGP